METYKYFIIIFSLWILGCYVLSQFKMPNSFSLNKIVGKKYSLPIAIIAFVGIAYLMIIEGWNQNNIEGLTKAQMYSKNANEEADAAKKNKSSASPGVSMGPAGAEMGPAMSPLDVSGQLAKMYPDVVDIPESNIIPDGYYKILIKNAPQMLKMRPIPSECKLAIDPKNVKKDSDVDSKAAGIIPIKPSGNYLADQNKCLNVIEFESSYNKFSKGLTYDANNLGSYAGINPELRGSEKEANQTNFDVSLNMIDPYPVFYEPGSFPFSSTGYLPNYEDSIYLSKTTNLSQVAPITNAPYLQGGFCKQYEKDDLTRNAKCTALDSETCASTGCCVLVGGTKCVAGNEKGPVLKTTFSDVTIKNRDYWYYQGKCVGNCP
jgi:hypothetical protein